jgi:molybdopterin/thiamine biosynthesis adenylyltransferase
MMGVKKIGLFDMTIVDEIDAKNSIYFDRNNIGKHARSQACREYF